MNLGQGAQTACRGLVSKNKNKPGPKRPNAYQKHKNQKVKCEKMKRVSLRLEPMSQRLQTRASTTGVTIHLLT